MPSTTPSPADLREWLKFVIAPGLGSLAAARLLAQFGCPRLVFSASDHALANFGLTASRIKAVRNLAQSSLDVSSPELDRLLAWGECDAQAILTPVHAEYPALLKEIPVPPPILYRLGTPISVCSGVAIVGARKATAAGCATARGLAGDLAKHGVAVVSGMALGIDAAAHLGALDADGFTIAVLGCGSDVIYPRANTRLYHRIVEQGCVLSEFAPGSSPRKHYFPQRNRLISGLSLGTVVVEAGLRSGSLSTARHALEQGREVLAVPGSVHSANSRGPHQLIRDGAQLVETSEDILRNLPDWQLPHVRHEGSAVDSIEPEIAPVQPALRRVWETLDFHPLAVDELISRAGMSASAVSAALSELEVEGHIRMEGCGYAKVPQSG